MFLLATIRYIKCLGLNKGNQIFDGFSLFSNFVNFHRDSNFTTQLQCEDLIMAPIYVQREIVGP